MLDPQLSSAEDSRMHITAPLLLGFSPTDTSRSVLRAVAEGMGHPGARYIDMAPRATGARGIRPDPAAIPNLGDGDAILFAVPVYAGRVPESVELYLRAVAKQRNGTTDRSVPRPTVYPAVIVVVYGNRAYDDALVELYDLVEAAGFAPVAAAAFVGEHSYSSEKTPVAVGRPNSADLRQARQFGGEVVQRLFDRPSMSAGADPPVLILPGQRPYRERKPRRSEAPSTDIEQCILCGACAEACPLGIVTVTDRVETDATECIYCCACVKECPNGSRQVSSEHILHVAEWLHRNHAQPQSPELFYAW